MKKPDRIELPRKPRYVTLAADIDFFGLFKKIEKRFDNCFILESLGEESHISRYSIIGFDPEQILYATEGALHIQQRDGSSETFASDNPYYLLRNRAPGHHLAQVRRRAHRLHRLRLHELLRADAQPQAQRAV